MILLLSPFKVLFRVLSIIIVFNIILYNILIRIILFLFLFQEMEIAKNETNKSRMPTLSHHSMVCKLYTQIRGSLMRKILRTTSLLITSQLLLFYFFTCCAKPVIQNPTFFYSSILYTCFCKFDRNATRFHGHIWNKKRPYFRSSSTSFVKCLKKHPWLTVSLI